MKRQVIISGICFGVLSGLFLFTNPTKLPSFLLITPFILLFILLLAVLSSILQKRGVSHIRSVKIGALVAAFPLLLLVLQSLGQLTIRDVIVVFILFTLSYFYLSRDTKPS